MYYKVARLPEGVPRLPIRVFVTPARAPRLYRVWWLIKPPRPGGGMTENGQQTKGEKMDKAPDAYVAGRDQGRSRQAHTMSLSGRGGQYLGL